LGPTFKLVPVTGLGNTIIRANIRIALSQNRVYAGALNSNESNYTREGPNQTEHGSPGGWPM